jgi:hypothetical protein
MGSARTRHPTVSRSLRQDPLNKYLKAEMPEIHNTNVSGPFDLVNFQLLATWDKHLEGKLVIIPFGVEIETQDQLCTMKDHIFVAITEITNSQTMGISALMPNDKATERGRYPTTFLVYNLADTHCQILQECRVWASLELTFCVAPMGPCHPNFLFTIGGFTTNDTKEVQEMVSEIWNDDASREFFNSITQAMKTDEHIVDPPPTQAEIQAFIKSI